VLAEYVAHYHVRRPHRALHLRHHVQNRDPLRSHGGVPGQLITVDDPDDPDGGLRFIPETGNTGVGGGTYLLLDACPGSGGDPHAAGDVPMVAITGLADLGNYQHALRLNLDPPSIPVEFFDDPAHAPDCPLRSPSTEHHNQE
jgi:hypothetical protein